MSPITRWGVRRRDRDGRRALPAVDLTGPGLDDLVYDIATRLAEAAGDPEHPLHGAWERLVVAAVAPAARAELHGPGDRRMSDLVGDMCEAWNGLVRDLPASIRLVDAEARYVALLLDEACGRIGQVAA